MTRPPLLEQPWFCRFPNGEVKGPYRVSSERAARDAVRADLLLPRLPAGTEFWCLSVLRGAEQRVA